MRGEGGERDCVAIEAFQCLLIDVSYLAICKKTVSTFFDTKLRPELNSKNKIKSQKMDILI